MKACIGVGALSLASALLFGCQSPEARRQLGGGPGSDVGNRSSVVAMHEGSRPYYQTPGRIGPFGGADLDPARQADHLGQRVSR